MERGVIECGTWIQRSRFQFHGVWYDVRGYNVLAFNVMGCGTTYVDTTFSLSMSWGVVRRTWIQRSRFQCHGVWYDVRGYNVLAFNVMECGTWLQRSHFQKLRSVQIVSVLLAPNQNINSFEGAVTCTTIYKYFFSVSQNLYCRAMSLNEYRRMKCRHHSERQFSG